MIGGRAKRKIECLNSCGRLSKGKKVPSLWIVGADAMVLILASEFDTSLLEARMEDLGGSNCFRCLVVSRLVGFFLVGLEEL